MRRVFRRAGLRVGVQEFRVPGRGRSRNVIGVYDTPRTCLRIVMAHTDSAPGAPGANDNASGLGVVAVARRAADADRPALRRLARGDRSGGARLHRLARPPRRAGARATRRARTAARRRLQWALSLDEVGRDRPFWLRSPSSAVRPTVERALLDAAGSVDVPVSWVRDESTGNSDHREFELLGLPAAKLGVGAGGEPCRHMPCDRPSRLDPKSLVLARRMTAEALRAR